nr:hypothetical protein [Tanacetum cinerariifolium]
RGATAVGRGLSGSLATVALAFRGRAGQLLLDHGRATLPVCRPAGIPESGAGAGGQSDRPVQGTGRRMDATEAECRGCEIRKANRGCRCFWLDPVGARLV